jgi:hypothetical protein
MTSPLERSDWTLWSGTIGLDSSVAARIGAAIAAGCGRFSLGPADVARVARDGTTVATSDGESGMPD